MINSFRRPVRHNGANFCGIEDVRLAFFNNLLRDGDNGVWNAISILMEGGIDPDEAEYIVGDWNGGVL
jgi:hypothetical protein